MRHRKPSHFGCKTQASSRFARPGRTIQPPSPQSARTLANNNGSWRARCNCSRARQPASSARRRHSPSASYRGLDERSPGCCANSGVSEFGAWPYRPAFHRVAAIVFTSISLLAVSAVPHRGTRLPKSGPTVRSLALYRHPPPVKPHRLAQATGSCNGLRRRSHTDVSKAVCLSPRRLRLADTVAAGGARVGNAGARLSQPLNEPQPRSSRAAPTSRTTRPTNVSAPAVLKVGVEPLERGVSPSPDGQAGDDTCHSDAHSYALQLGLGSVLLMERLPRQRWV
jgi:hypothetical protein